MSSPPSPPPAPSSGQMVQQQEQANSVTGQQQQGFNMVGQETPYGSLSYSTSIDPTTGQPTYMANQQLTPEQQGLLGESQATGLIQGGTGVDLAANMMPFYANAPNFNQGASSLTGQAEAPVQAAYQRFFTPQTSQLDNQLRNQGIMPGTPAYQQQMDALTQQQNLTEGSWLANFQPTAFNEATQGYQIPESMISSLFGNGQPSSLPGSYVNTPQVNLAAPNAIQANQTSLAQQNFDYQQQVQAQNNLMSGIFQGGSSALMMLPMLAMM